MNRITVVDGYYKAEKKSALSDRFYTCGLLYCALFMIPGILYYYNMQELAVILLMCVPALVFSEKVCKLVDEHTDFFLAVVGVSAFAFFIWLVVIDWGGPTSLVELVVDMLPLTIGLGCLFWACFLCREA